MSSPHSPLLPGPGDDPSNVRQFERNKNVTPDYQPSSLTMDANMAKWIVPASMVFNVGMQVYGMQSKPVCIQ